MLRFLSLIWFSNDSLQLHNTIIFCHQGTAKDLLFPYLPKFAESFVQALSVPDGDTSDSGLKTEVIKVCYHSNNSVSGLIRCIMQK